MMIANTFCWIELLFTLIKRQYRRETGVHPVDLKIDGQDSVIASTVSQLNKNICVVTDSWSLLHELFDNSRKCQINLIFSSKHWSFFPPKCRTQATNKNCFHWKYLSLPPPPSSLPPPYLGLQSSLRLWLSSWAERNIINWLSWSSAASLLIVRLLYNQK